MLITRPTNKGVLLAQRLQELGIHSTCQAFFDYQDNTTQKDLRTVLATTQASIIIFISVAAVKHANDIWPIKFWFNDVKKMPTLIAVGEATKQELVQLDIGDIISPVLQNSEGVLDLPELSQVNSKNILIIRGNGGREHLAEMLLQRGAVVEYIESYQRVWRTFNVNIVKEWQGEQINCIVITSNELLLKVFQLMDDFGNVANNTQTMNNYWWIVPSTRIADNAKKLGLINIINANGANDQSMINTIVGLQQTF